MDSLYRTVQIRPTGMAGAPAGPLQSCGPPDSAATAGTRPHSAAGQALEQLPRQAGDATLELEVEQPHIQLGGGPTGASHERVECHGLVAERLEHRIRLRPIPVV